MRWTYLKWAFGMWFGGAWALAGTVLLLVAAWQWSRYTAAKNDFYEVHATILEKTHVSRQHDAALVLQYTSRDGAPHHTTLRVRRRDFDGYAIGGDVPLYVSGADPTDAWLRSDGAPSSFAAWLLSGLALVFFVPGILSFALAVRRALARAETLRTGLATDGRVTEVGNSGWVINNVRYQMVRYEWTGIDGAKHEGASLPFHPSRLAWDEGDPIKVFVDPDDPARGEVDLSGVRDGGNMGGWTGAGF